MATFTVQPIDDGYDMRGNWETVGPKKTTGHTRKRAAINAARRRGGDGDTLVIKRTDGTIQEKRTMRKGSTKSRKDNGAEGGGLWGEEWAKQQATRSTGIDFLHD